MPHSKIDFKRHVPAYSANKGRFDLVDVPAMSFLMIDGHGDPNTAPDYADALATIYPVAYKLKFFSKVEVGRDYVVPPLEGLWWSDDMDAFTTARDKSQWDWTLMIMVPEWLNQEHVEMALNKVVDAPRLNDLRLGQLDEGLVVQTLHIGSYDDEGPVLAHLHAVVIPEHGLTMVGKHHEIYLSDPRRVSPDKLRTILRQPVRANT